MTDPVFANTDRLVLRRLDKTDWPELSRMGGDPAVARMLATVRSPWAEADILTWIAESLWRGRLGFRLGITLKDGTLVGACRIGGKPVNLSYWIGQDHWSKGYATEAAYALAAGAITRFGLAAIEADAYADNSGSRRVLEKLGFVRVGASECSSAARVEDAPAILYRLEAKNLKAPR